MAKTWASEFWSCLEAGGFWLTSHQQPQGIRKLQMIIVNDWKKLCRFSRVLKHINPIILHIVPHSVAMDNNRVRSCHHTHGSCVFLTESVLKWCRCAAKPGRNIQLHIASATMTSTASNLPNETLCTCLRLHLVVSLFWLGISTFQTLRHAIQNPKALFTLST